MKDYCYTIHKEGRQTIQRQTFEGIGTIIICENRGAKCAEVAAMTEYGNYCFRWEDTSDICMVLRSTDDYLMDKLLDGHGEKRVMDAEATSENVRRDARLKISEGADRALERCATEDDLLMWTSVWGLDWEDVKPHCVYRYSEAACLFMERVLPAIRRSAKELEAMRAVLLH